MFRFFIRIINHTTGEIRDWDDLRARTPASAVSIAWNQIKDYIEATDEIEISVESLSRALAE